MMNAPVKLTLIAVTLLGVSTFAFIPGIAAVVRTRYLRPVILGLVLLTTAALMTKASLPHYVAPALGMFYVVCGAGLRSLHRQSRRLRMPNVALCLTVFFLAYLPVKALRDSENRMTRFANARETVRLALEAQPQKSLVFVHYDSQHDYHQEWVQNRADIDNAKVVWARSMGEERDRQLAQYFSDRAPWTLEVDRDAALTRITFDHNRD